MRRDFWVGWLFGVASIWFVAIIASLIAFAAPGDTLGHGDCKGTEWEKVRWERTAKGGGIAVETEPCHIPEPRVSEAPSQSTSYGGVTTDGASPIPESVVACESGDDYNAVNPSSGAYGRYQVIPSTWAAHCSDLGRDPRGQDACAARILEAQGPGAWECWG